MSGSSTPSNATPSFQSVVFVTASVSGIYGVGSVVTMPTPPTTGTTYQVLIVNHGPWPVRVIGLDGPQGALPLRQADTLVAANTSRLFTDPLFSTAATLTLEAQHSGGNSVVDIHLGTTGLSAQPPTFVITG